MVYGNFQKVKTTYKTETDTKKISYKGQEKETIQLWIPQFMNFIVCKGPSIYDIHKKSGF